MINIELGNLAFGNSRGEFEFPDRDIVNSEEWQDLCELARVNSCYGHSENNKHENSDMEENGDIGFENDTFLIRAYYWGDSEYVASLPNFVFKPTNFRIDWYKYAFRDAYMNRDLDVTEILAIFRTCIESIDDSWMDLKDRLREFIGKESNKYRIDSYNVAEYLADNKDDIIKILNNKERD